MDEVANSAAEVTDGAATKKRKYTKPLVLAYAPEKVIIIGLDIPDIPGHPLSRPHRCLLPIDEGLVERMLDPKIGWFGTIVVQKQADGRIFVVAGRQRIRAAREANRRLEKDGSEHRIEVLGMHFQGSDADLIAAAENVRQNDTEIEIAQTMAAMLNRGRTYDEIARAHGKSRDGARLMVALTQADGRVLTAVEAGRITITAAYQLARLPYEEQAGALDQVEEESGDTARGTGAAAKELVRTRRARKRGVDAHRAMSPRILRGIIAAAKESTAYVDPLIPLVIGCVLGDVDPRRIGGMTALLRAVDPRLVERSHDDDDAPSTPTEPPESSDAQEVA